MTAGKYILGISAFYHDSAACLVKDGEIAAAAQEERFTRKKHDDSFPVHAIRYCLEEAGIGVRDLAYVGFYDKPFLKFERILLTYLNYAPFGVRSFLQAMPLWLKEKLFLKDFIARELDYEGEILFSHHHESHAASAFFPSPFQDAAILTIDGVGEWETASYGVGEGNQLKLFADIKFPHSLGLLYSSFTYYTGFRVNSGEYKLMGLAPYGEPKYVDAIKKHLIDVKEDGSFRLNMRYFNYCSGLTMTNHHFDRLFDGPPRVPESEITQRHMDLARSIQDVTEEIMLKMACHVHEQTKKKNLVLAGGVALNCVGNGKILREGPFKDIWIQPAAGDAGGALGAALLIWHHYLGKERKADHRHDQQKGSFLGPSFTNDRIRSFLNENSVPFQESSKESLPAQIAKMVDEQKVVGLFSGRMEFGPRALGARSIIGDPRSVEMQSVLNLKIKFRESFRPFAPSILEDRAGEYFDLECSSPYMLLVAQVKQEKRNEDSSASVARGLEKLKVKRSAVPAVTHVDYSARVQTVSQKVNPFFYEILKSFERLTGCPLVINTSFNVRGEPIVCTPEDAYRCFMCTDMDYLILEDFIIDKRKQPEQGRYAKETISQVWD